MKSSLAKKLAAQSRRDFAEQYEEIV